MSLRTTFRFCASTESTLELGKYAEISFAALLLSGGPEIFRGCQPTMNARTSRRKKSDSAIRYGSVPTPVMINKASILARPESAEQTRGETAVVASAADQNLFGSRHGAGEHRSVVIHERRIEDSI